MEAKVVPSNQPPGERERGKTTAKRSEGNGREEDWRTRRQRPLQGRSFLLPLPLFDSEKSLFPSIISKAKLLKKKLVGVRDGARISAFYYYECAA